MSHYCGIDLHLHTDPALNCREDQTDMIVAEIKQGRARVNSATRNPGVLGAALTCFGCCEAVEAPRLVKKLLRHGQAFDQNGHQIRMVLFASQGEHVPKGWHWVHLGKVFLFHGHGNHKKRDNDKGSEDRHEYHKNP